jgi:hypothetical protein
MIILIEMANILSYRRPCAQAQWNWDIIIPLRTLLLLVTRIYRCQADPYGKVVARSGNLKRERERETA